MGCRIRRGLSGWLLVGAIVLGLGLGFGLFNPPSTTAAIRHLEEAPGQHMVQSRQTLPDQHRHTWQVILFKRYRADGTATIDLRLIGFPGVGEIDRAHPLTLTNSLGKTWRVADSSTQIFSDTTAPQPNVGQYDLQPWLAQLPAAIPLTLTLPTITQEGIQISVPPSVIQEWQQVAFEE